MKNNATKKALSLLMAALMVFSVLSPLPARTGSHGGVTKAQAAGQVLKAKANSWRVLREKISAAQSGDVIEIEITNDIVAEITDNTSDDHGTINISGGKTVIIKAEAGKNVTIWRKDGEADFPMFKTSNDSANLILGDGLTLSGKTCGAAADDRTIDMFHKDLVPGNAEPEEKTEPGGNQSGKVQSGDKYIRVDNYGEVKAYTEQYAATVEFEPNNGKLLVKINNKYVVSASREGVLKLSNDSSNAIFVTDTSGNPVTSFSQNTDYLLKDPRTYDPEPEDSHYVIIYDGGLYRNGSFANAAKWSSSNISSSGSGSTYWVVPGTTEPKFESAQAAKDSPEMQQYNNDHPQQPARWEIPDASGNIQTFKDPDERTQAEAAFAAFIAANPVQGCDSGDCKTYTKDDFGNSEKNKATADAPKGFFVQVDQGTVTLAGATLENFNTSTNKDQTPKHVAPVVASGSTAKFIVQSGSIQNNIVGYVAEDGNSKSGANAIKQYIAGLARTDTAGAIIYTNGAKGLISGGTISSNRGDAGAIIAQGQETKVEFPAGGNAMIQNNAGIHYGGAAYIYNGAFMGMGSGTMDSNFAWNMGGAVYVSSEVYGSTKWMIPNSTQKVSEAFFSLQGGSLTNNYSVNRGGAIYVESNGVSLLSGNISNNRCRSLGGAIYVAGDGIQRMYQLYISNGCITGNTAVKTNEALDKYLPAINASKPCVVNNTLLQGSNLPGDDVDYADYAGYGGGLWLCAFGGNATFGYDDKLSDKIVTINGNKAETQGQDIKLRPTRRGEGSAINFIGNIDANTWINEKNGRALVPNTTYTGPLPITNSKPDGQACNSALTISGNMARVGGAIAANGTVVFGPTQDAYRVHASLDVTKTWGEGINNKESITLSLGVKDADGTDGTIYPLDGYSQTLTGKATPKDQINENTLAWETSENGQWSAAFGMPLTYVKKDGSIVPVFTFTDPDNNGRTLDPSKPGDLPRIYELVKNNRLTGAKLNANLVITEKVNGQDPTSYEFTAYAVTLNSTAYKEDTHTYYDKAKAEVGSITTKAMTLAFAQGVKNEKPVEEEPKIEKYVNNQVHATLENYDQKFTYSILAYVPADATSITITDTLEPTLRFVKFKDGNKERVVPNDGIVVFKENDHTVNGTVASPRTVGGNVLRVATGLANGTATANGTITVDDRTIKLNVTETFINMVRNQDIGNSNKDKGFWIMLSYEAEYDPAAYTNVDLAEIQTAAKGWATDTEPKAVEAHKLSYIKENGKVKWNASGKRYILLMDGVYYRSNETTKGTKATSWEKHTNQTQWATAFAGLEEVDAKVIDGDVREIRLPYNGFVLGGDNPHHGTKNQASYTLTGGRYGSSEYKTNIVTVEAPTTKLEAEKKWNNMDGTHTWPEGVTVTISIRDNNDTEVGTIVLDKDHPKKQSQELPKLKGVTYSLLEISIDGYKTSSDSMASENLTEGSEFGTVFTNTQKSEEEPEIEKYVNEAVHKDILLDEVFTFDILAYVTKDAEKVVITDTLAPYLELADKDKTPSNWYVQDVGPKNNHNVAYDVAGKETQHITSATVTKLAGTANNVNEGYTLVGLGQNAKRQIETVTIDGKDCQKLIITIDDASNVGGNNIRGHWIKIRFTAKIKDGVTIDQLQAAGVYREVKGDVVNDFDKDRATPNTGNKPVNAGATHTGIPNRAEYTIDATNEANYKDESNTVTVKPKTTEIQVQKTWAIDGKDEWPDNTTVTFGVFQTKNGQETKVQGTVDAAGKYAAGTGDLTVELTKAKKNLTISNLPMLTGVTYSAREIAVTVNGESKAVAYNDGGKAGQVVTDALTYIVKMLSENNNNLAKYMATNSKPAVEKYVEKKVHAELDTFDTGFEYDIMAYVPAGATAIEIYDTLKPQLVLKSTAADIKASVVYKASNDHTVNGSVKATGTSVPEANIKVTIDPSTNKVTVRVENLGTEDGKLNLEGQWVQATLKAEINPNDYDKVAKKLSGDTSITDAEVAWAKVTENTPVLGGDATHEGLVNKASYKIELDNISTSEFETNEVTVKPKTVDLKITKRWENDTPAFRNGKEAEFKAALKVQSVKGEAVTDLDPQPTPTITKNDDNTWTVEWKGLINLDGVTYQVVESQIPGYNAPTGSPAKNGETITNTKPEDEIPEIEKYVEKDVHADLVYYDKEFVYDIIAYVPNDATSITITDKLDAKLTFVSTQAEIAASAVAIAKSNHKATSVTVAEGEEHSVEETGTKISATAAIEAQNLTVTVANIGTEDGKQNIGGKSVRITFTAKIKANEDGSYTLLKDTDLEKVTEDTPVLSQLNLESGNKAGNHSGIKNQAKYTITTENDAAGSPKYPETPSNEVTVVPETEDLLVNKKWIGKEGTADQLKNALRLYANEADVTTLYASHATISKDKAEWKDLPKLQGVIYSVKEDTISGYVAPTYKNTDAAVTDKALNDGTITNKVIVEDISIIIEGDKVLLNAAGNTTQKTLKAGDFSFALYKVDGGADAAVAAGAEPLEVVTNDADGKFAFAAISYKEADAGKSFYYVVKELVGSDETITLTTPESNEYRVTVTVSQEDGVLKTNLTENKVNVAFTNTYTQPEAEPVALTITASKKLENAELKDDMFTFELREGTTLLESVKNKGEKVTFKAINYASAGEHIYTITEKKEDLAGISYDGSTKTVTVNVALNEVDPNHKFLYIEGVTENTVDAGTFTNVKGQVEKYVNKDVDATLKNPKEVFTFDVMGYVASNATKVTITDTLVKALEFVDADGKVTTDGKAAVLLVQAQASNNSTVNGTVANAGTKIDTFEAAISDQKLTVTITDAAELAKLQGKWVQLTFGARIKSDYANEAAVKADPDFKLVDDNKTVQGGAASHDGLTNKAEYEVELPNNGKVTDESNTVTVEPTYTKIQVEKKWQDAAGTALDAADIPVQEVTVKLLANGDDTGKTLTLKASENWKGEVDGLPQYPLNDKGQVSKDAQPIVYRIEEITEIDGFTSTVDGTTLINKKGDQPEIEKYVNQDVHKDVKINETFTYDIIAYVTKDATKLTIGDTLIKNLEFVSTKDDVKVVDLGEENNHKTNSAYSGENADATVAKAGIAVEATVTIDSSTKKLEVVVDNVETQGLRGHYVKVSFQAKLSADADYVTINAAANKPVLSDKDHEGVDNKASYVIETDHEPYDKLETNVVTVKPEKTSIKVNKEWKINGAASAWPAGATVEVKLQKTEGETTTDVKDAEDKAITATLSATKTEHSFTDLLVIEGVTYSVKEGAVTGADDFTKGEAKKNADGSYTITNILGEQPEIEKYVNQDVHKDVKINETFTYDIIAYVTKDATKLTIGDTLIKNLEFVSTKDDVKVVDLGEENNHKTNSAYSGENADATVAKAGIAVEATVTIDSSTKKLEVVVDNVETQGLRGHYVKVSFQAKLSADADYVTINAADNKPVLSDKDHEGVDNKASYVVDTDHGPYNELETNVVTVKPEKTSIKVNKEWKINGVASTWPAGATVEVKLQKTEGGTTTDVATETLSTTKTEHTFADLLVIEGVTYSVKEGAVTGADDFTKGEAKKNADGSYTITNTLGEQPEIEKYVNQNVHEFINKDDEFTYDIIAYVTKDADKIIITDELNSQLTFVGGVADVKVYDLGTTNNHNTADKAKEADGTATVATGTLITTATVTINGQKLEVVIDNQVTVDKDAGTITRAKDDVTKLRGHYVRVEFKAALTDAAKADLSKLALETIKDNAPLNVTEAQKEHEGVANKASYQIEVGNEGKYEDESNTVTVKPEEPEIEKYVNKKSASGTAKDGGVHTDLEAFYEVYTYDIQAYIAKDATVAEITDQLKNVLEFVGNGPTKVVIKAGEAYGKAPKLSKAGTAPKDEWSIDQEAWKAGKLVLTLGKADSTEVLKAAGQWIQITFDAKIKDTFKSIDALKKAGADVWQTIVENDPIDDAKVDNAFSGAKVDKHEGIANDSSYRMKKAGVDVGNTWSYNDKSNTVTVQPKTVKVSVNKTWIGKPADVLRLALRRDGVIIEMVTISAGSKWSYEWKSLPAGYKYEVMEPVPTNAGFVLTGSDTQVDKDGNVTVSLENTRTTTVKINKTDLGGTELAGAEIVVKDTQGNEIASWISKEGETMDVVLKAGDYVFIEVNAPEGYECVTTEIGFTVNGDGTVTVNETTVEPAGAVEVIDGVIVLLDKVKEFPVKINKTDMGGTELAGAVIEVKDANGKVIATWTSEEGKTMDLDLVPGEYTFREVNAPDGYECVTTEIGFTVDKVNGRITVTTNVVEPAGAVEVIDGVIILKDELKKEEPTTEAEEEETDDTEPDEGGSLPPGDEDESTTVNAETDSPSTEPETEPVGTLPPSDDEETTTVNAETTVPNTPPDTGDHSNLGLYIGLIAAAGVAGVGLLLATRKKKEEE